MKILNLYCGIGGNRKLWPLTEKDHVVAVEIDPEIAAIYKNLFPNDEVIIGDAHDYLLKNYDKFDFIWTSPPCPSHSRMRFLKNNCEEAEKKYPDMNLYQEILYLQHFFKGVFVVENVISYYDPLIKPQLSENHYFWTNFNITSKPSINRQITRIVLDKKWGFDLSNVDISKRMKDKMLNNMVRPELGLHIWNCAFKEKQQILEVI